MQYILTEKEFQNIQKAINSHKENSALVINALCKEVANNKPVTDGQEPWGCIHTVQKLWYCDGCPVVKVCDMHKEFTK